MSDHVRELCVVAASGGFDSSLTLAMLKYAGYENIVACHFKYGHRGQDAEYRAIIDVTSRLGIPLKVLDIEQLVRSIDPTSMLIDKNAKITTGTRDGLKKLDAWVCGRNMIFLTLMASLAESLTMQHNYDKINLLGGFLNLTESGHYPDNSEYFLSSFLEHAKYGTLVGSRLRPLYGLANLMKSDLWVVAREFGLLDLVKHTISCDRPIVDSSGIPRNCFHDGQPACGSGLLSWWAAKMVGMSDHRQFYEVDDSGYIAHKPKHLDTSKVLSKDIHSIIDRILFPADKIENLHNRLES